MNVVDYRDFPDYWCKNLETENPTDEDITFWREIFKIYAEIMGKKKTVKTDRQIIKWLQNPHSDGKEYSMWGNGICLNVVDFVMSAIEYWSKM